ncbi:MAG: HAD family hydrolase [Clostridia bacterium]|nr:HAD family hydrolase [Clostridia bacterium]
MIRNVVWDWNGTLLDDVEASLVSVNDMLDSFSIPPITLETYYTYVDTPISRFYEHLFDLEKMPMSRLAPLFRERMAAHADQIGLMEHARETVACLADAGIRQWIISSAREESILRDLDMFGIQNYFEDVLGESNDYAGSKIERAVAYFRSHDLQGKESLVIGDTLHDLDLVDALTARCLLFAKGHQGKAILQGHGVPVLNSLEELLPYVRQVSE